MPVVELAQFLHRGFDGAALLDDRGQRGNVRIDGHAAGHDAVHHEAVAEQAGVLPHPVFLEAEKLGQAEGEGGIIAQRAEIAQMVGDALAFQQQRAHGKRARRRLDAARRLDRSGVGPL